MRLKNKTAIITGGGTGIGRATALLFAKEGAKVMIAGRREEPLARTVETIKAQGGQAAYVSTDVSKADEVERMVAKTIKAYGRIDILYNNAGVFVGVGKTIEELTEDEWDTLMAIDLKSVFLCSKCVIPHMKANGGGAIVNCSSISGHIGQKKEGAYNSAKGGVELLTKSVALDFAENNIRVNTVCPGWIEIEFNREMIKQMKAAPDKPVALETSWNDLLRMHPLGGIGQPEDVAYAVLYLASDEASWVTGTSLMVDGGYTAQ